MSHFKSCTGLPGWWVPLFALLSLCNLVMMIFQLALTSSNSADSAGSCLRMSSPRKIFCTYFKITKNRFESNTWITTEAQDGWCKLAASSVGLQSMKVPSQEHHPDCNAQSANKSFMVNNHEIDSITSKYIHCRCTVRIISMHSIMSDNVRSQVSTCFSNAFTKRDAFIVDSVTWWSSSCWKISSVPRSLVINVSKKF